MWQIWTETLPRHTEEPHDDQVNDPDGHTNDEAQQGRGNEHVELRNDLEIQSCETESGWR